MCMPCQAACAECCQALRWGSLVCKRGARGVRGVWFSIANLSCPKPSLFWVMKPTLAHTTALTASHTPVSPTDTAGTHSHFTHAQTQPHQSTALIRMGKGYHLVTLVAAGSPLHSAPLQRSRALATTARRRQALRSVWWTCCGHSRPSHAACTRTRHRARSSRSWRRV